ncbi:uncharacterized protein [Palaemon carinicauda]|uniref:uncharacterized protein n=1 Tax=Palaemon carinicauda TaxID=392227 RepID=UPI0035B64286
MMASYSTSNPQLQSLYSTEEKNLIRLGSIHKKVATKVLHFVFEKGSSARPHNVSLLEFYRSQGIDDVKFLRRLFDEQKKRILSDFKGDSFDITLLYYCLRNGSHGLAEAENENWKKEDQASIESLLTIIKNKRNKLAHEQPTYTNGELIQEATDLKRQLIQILEFSKQLHNVSDIVVSQEISWVESNIQSYIYEDFEAKSFDEYKKQLFFEAQVNYVNDKGVEDVLEHYERIFEDQVSTVNHLAKINLPLDEIYIDLKLRAHTASSQEELITYDDLLLDHDKKTDSVIVISGHAGTGKTTLTKKIIWDWRENQSTMKHLSNHVHLLKAQMRNTAVRSFDDLLHHIMPKVSKDFKPCDLKNVLLQQKILIILDGLDELNNSSCQLFDELLYLKKSFNFTLLLTTRPEKLKYIEKKLISHDIKMKHIQLLGIPSEKKYEFVKKYHSKISKHVSSITNIKELLSYLKKTEHRLKDLWRVPYNLALIIILWVYGHVDVTNINTAPKLYTEILKLQKSKLKDRLRSNESTHFLDEEDLEKRIENFLYSLGKEAITGLKNDHINLPLQSYEKLEKVCDFNAVPTQEMVGAFLQRIPGPDIVYSFPHKGLQDYLSALYIWMELTGKDHRYDVDDILKCMKELFLKKRVRPDASENICKYAKERLEYAMKIDQSSFTAKALGFLVPKLKSSSIIHNIFEKLHGSSKYDASKFQNVFICLIGMFFLEKQEVKERNKLEVLNFLQESGVWDKDSWISILNSVECDEYVASFICKQSQILEKDIKITDSSLSAYLSLMKALKKPWQNATNVKVDIEVNGDLNECHNLLELIHSSHFRLKRILITENNIDDYTIMLRNLEIGFFHKSKVHVDLCIDGDLHDTAEVVKQIKKNNFFIRTLKVRDFEIKDSNESEYTAMLRSFPCPLKDVLQATVNFNIKGTHAETGDLLQLINHLDVRIGKLSIYESNFGIYSSLLDTMIFPSKSVSNCEIELLCPSMDILDISSILCGIKKNKLFIGKLEVKDLKINDDNLTEHIVSLKSLLPVCKILPYSHIGVFFNMKSSIKMIDELMLLMISLHFKVRGITITNQNFLKYTSLMKDLLVSEEEAPYVKVNIEDKIDLLQYKHLLRLIKSKGFSITKIDQIDDVIINDDNTQEYFDILESLPPIEEVASGGKIYVNLKKDLIEIKELLKLVSKSQFLTEHLVLKEGSISVSEDKIREYMDIFSFLPNTGKGSPLGKIDVVIVNDLSACKDLLKLIRDKKFSIKLRMNEENIFVTDDNFEFYSEFISFLPMIEEGDFEGRFNIIVNKNLKDIKGFLKKVSERGMRVGNLEINERNISVTDDNADVYMDILTSLPMFEKGAFHADLEIVLSKSLVAMKDILELIHKKQLPITKLVYIREDININDSNMDYFTELFASLPHFMEDSFRERIRVDIEKRNADPTTFLKELSRWRMALDLKFTGNFRWPWTLTDAAAALDEINQVFHRCEVLSYIGQLDNISTFPASLHTLHGSVSSNEAFVPLKELILSGKHNIQNLSLSINSIKEISKHLLTPINLGDIEGTVLLFLPDVTKDTRKKGCEIAKSLMPTDSGELGAIFFPRCQDAPRELILQLKESGVRIRSCVVFPTSSMPISQEEREELACLFKEVLDITKGIFWGKPDWCEAGDIFDIDTWHDENSASPAV